MTSRSTLFALGLLAVLLTGCAESRVSSAPTVTPVVSSATPIPPVDTPTPVEATAGPSPTEEPRCPDPYPQGAPYEAEDDDPLRVIPSGSPPALPRYQSMPFRNDAELQRVMLRSLAGERRRFAVVVKNIADGSGVVIAPERRFYAASLFKTWVLLEAFHQREQGLLHFDEQYIVSDYYAGEFRLNPGELEICSTVAVGDALASMIGISDNVAANMTLDRVGSSNVNATLVNLGLPVSGFRAGLDLPTTGGEMALLFESIARGKAVNGQASLDMLSLLLTQAIADRIPALLPAGTSVAHKTGNWSNATHDAGVVFSPNATYVIVVLTDYGYNEDGASRIAALSRAVYDYYNPGQETAS